MGKNKKTVLHLGVLAEMPENIKKKQLFTYTPVDSVSDPVNLQILLELQANPRLTMTELGRRVAITIAPPLSTASPHD
jgi:hypothetical protein